MKATRDAHKGPYSQNDIPDHSIFRHVLSLLYNNRGLAHSCQSVCVFTGNSLYSIMEKANAVQSIPMHQSISVPVI